MSDSYTAFSHEEYATRLAHARAALRDSGFDLCISLAPEHHFYLAGYDSWVGVNSPQALIFGLDDDRPTLVVRNVDLPLVHESAWLDDVRSYHLGRDDPVGLMATVAREKGLKGGRVAMECQSYALTYGLGNALAAALSPAEIGDATELLGALRLIKSPAELDYLRQAGQIAERGLVAARAAARPGMSEIDLAAVAEGAMRAAGGDYWAIPTELASGPRSPGGHAAPRSRIMRSGELVHLEFAGVMARYHAVAIHTMALGQPSARAIELYDLTRASLQAGVASIEPGIAVSDVEEASLTPLQALGLADYATMRFGYGVGIAYPPIWLETLQISRGSKQTLQKGMVFVLHAYLSLPQEGLGIIQGGTYLLGDQGLEMLVGGGDRPLDIR
ncbi:MAG: Xaa-Pro peptidase family protein [Pseudomonadota bacterium]